MPLAHGRLLQQPAATLLLQPIVAADEDDVAVVQQTIKARDGDHGIAEHVRLPADRVSRHDHGTASLGHRLEVLKKPSGRGPSSLPRCRTARRGRPGSRHRSCRNGDHLPPELR